jgi:hypothetical protein
MRPLPLLLHSNDAAHSHPQIALVTQSTSEPHQDLQMSVTEALRLRPSASYCAPSPCATRASQPWNGMTANRTGGGCDSEHVFCISQFCPHEDRLEKTRLCTVESRQQTASRLLLMQKDARVLSLSLQRHQQRVYTTPNRRIAVRGTRQVHKQVFSS